VKFVQLNIVKVIKVTVAHDLSDLKATQYGATDIPTTAVPTNLGQPLTRYSVWFLAHRTNGRVIGTVFRLSVVCRLSVCL